MVLQDRFIIVDECQLGFGVDQELVGHTGMVHVVDAAGQDGRQDLVGREDFIQGGAAEEDVGGLGDIRRVEVVVIWNILDINNTKRYSPVLGLQRYTIISMVDSGKDKSIDYFNIFTLF